MSQNKRLIEEDAFDQNIVGQTYSETYDLNGASKYSIHHVYDVNTPSAVEVPSADIDFEEDTFTLEDHGLTTGVKGQLTTSDTLPDPLVVATDYFVIVIDADTFQLAETLVDALAGTPISLIDAGVGDQTFTPTALAGGSIQVQASNDGVTWASEGTAVTVSADGNSLLKVADVSYRYMRISATLTAGRYALNSHVLIIGDPI
jgi:hypothetical protein